MGRKIKPSAGASSGRDYFPHEKGSIRKKWKNRTPVALIFPNSYSLGMSNLGFQQVYHLLNSDDTVVCERVFLPEPGTLPLSVESGRHLTDFHLLLFSVSFEQDYQNLIYLLQVSGIEPLASVRDSMNLEISSTAAGGQPIIVAGGVATFMNPEPLAPFVDLFIIGEAEPVLEPVMERLTDSAGKNKKELLADIACKIEGCYVPSLYQADYDDAGKFHDLRPDPGYSCLPGRVKKVIMQSPGTVSSHSRILSPTAEFSDLFMTELGRGCSRGCRFCTAGFIYRPPRLWKADSIINAIDSKPEECSRIGLLGMEMASPDDVSLIADYLSGKSCSLSFSSLRADIISSSLTELLGRSNLKSAAVAPDGASERLRLVINKGITENDVLSAAETLALKGIHNLKLYFMIGLPTETREDLGEMVDLVKKVKGKLIDIGRNRGRMGNLTLSINCFIPKPWTPFQFHPMEEIAVLKKKMKFLRQTLGPEPNIRIKAESPDKALFQAVLSRGDRKVGLALYRAVSQNLTWRRAFREENITPADYALRPRHEKEPFPWEIIDHGIERKFLWSEYQNGLRARATKPCDTTRCKRCGVC